MFEIYDQINKQLIPVPNAKEVKIEGWEDLTFFIHRPLTLEGFSRKSWRISEANTGCGIGESQPTKSVAIEYVTQKLAKFNTPEYRQILQEKAKELRRIGERI